MKLTEAVQTIQGIRQRTRRVLREVSGHIRVQEGKDPSRGRQLVQELRGLASRRAALRVQVARTLGDHPEVVAALAEAHVARLREQVLRSVVVDDGEPATPAGTPLLPKTRFEGLFMPDGAEGFESAFDALLRGRLGSGPRPTRRARPKRGQRTRRTVRRGTPEDLARELLDRQEEARQQVLKARLTLERLSAYTELKGGPRRPD